MYRGVKIGLQNIAKQDLGRAGQTRYARAVTKFTKPRTNHYSLPCRIVEFPSNPINMQRARKSSYLPVRSLFLLLLNCFVWPCLGPGRQDLHTFSRGPVLTHQVEEVIEFEFKTLVAEKPLHFADLYGSGGYSMQFSIHGKACVQWEREFKAARFLLLLLPTRT